MQDEFFHELIDPDTEQKKLHDKYRAILCDGIGLEVLSDILAMCHFGATLDPDNKAQIAEYNVGVSILAKCGVLKNDNMQNAIQSMLGMR